MIVGGMSVALFDLDDTLTDRRAIFREWAEDFARRHDLEGAAVEWMVAADDDGNRPRRDFFGMVVGEYSLPYSADDHEERHYSEFLALHRVTSATTNALRRLRASGWKIGIVTNGGPAQQAKIDYASLGELVDASCISSVLGVRKPEAAIFRHALDRCGCTADGGWMVGDNAVADVGGARSVGLRTIWLHHGRQWPERLGYQPDHQVASVSDAVDIILNEVPLPDGGR